MGLANLFYREYIRIGKLTITGFDGPWGDEAGETVSPDVLVDGDGNEERACDRLVRVNGVGRDNGRKGGDLETSGTESKDDDGLPRPVSLVSNSNNNVSNVHDDDEWNHGQQSEFGLSDASISLGELVSHPIAKKSGSSESNEGADQDGKVEETNLLGTKVVGRRGKDLGLSQVQREER